jgi:hypothetical protein
VFDETPAARGAPLTSQGSPYSIFKRALRRGDLAGVRAAATELPRVPLDDAFAICLLILEQQPGRYERAAVRWLGRLMAERRHVALRHVELTAGYLAALADPARARSGVDSVHPRPRPLRRVYVVVARPEVVQPVLAGASHNQIVAVPPIDGVVPEITEQAVLAAAVDLILAPETFVAIVGGPPGKDGVGTFRPDRRVRASGECDAVVGLIRGGRSRRQDGEHTGDHGNPAKNADLASHAAPLS